VVNLWDQLQAQPIDGFRRQIRPPDKAAAGVSLRVKRRYIATAAPRGRAVFARE
jgi:hypothetical protein